MIKKNLYIVLIINILLLQFICFDVKAQSDGFFNNWNDFENREDNDFYAPPMPGHGFTDDQDMPLGSGLLVLGGLGLGYAAFKKRKSLRKGATIALILLSFGVEAQEVDVEWNVVKGDCNQPMNGMAIVLIDGNEQYNAQYKIGAFVGDECRGMMLCNNVGAGHYYAFLQIYGTDNETIKFKVMDTNNNWVIFADCDDELTFVTNGMFGIPSPKEINLTTIYYNYNGGDVNQLSSYSLSNGKPVAKLPLRNCKVVMNADVTYSDDNVQVKDVILSADKKMEVAAGGGVKVMETVENPNGVEGIWLRAVAPQGTKGDYWDEKFSSVASLVCVSDNVEGTFETYFDNSAPSLNDEPNWHLISSPISSQVIHNGLDGNEFDPGVDDDFYLWNEATATWCNIKKDHFSETNTFHTVNGSFNFVPGRGYLASYSAAGVKSYQGTFNNGDVTVALTKTDNIDEKENQYAGLNLVGNPYPSFLDWENVEGWNRSKLQGYDSENPAESQCVIWVYNEDAGNYASYVQGTGVATNYGTRYIAPGQGFFVKATEAGNLVMRDGARTNEHTGSGFMKNENDNDDDNEDDNEDENEDENENENENEDENENWLARDGGLLKIRVENLNFGYDEVALAVSGNAMNVDKLFSLSETAPALYFGDGNGKFSIIINNEFENSIPLNFKAQQIGKYTIRLNPESVGFDFVELEDSFTGEKTNLLVDEYSFYSTKDDYENRFIVRFGINENEDENENFAYINGNELIVKGKGNLQIVDVLGRTIYEKELTSEENAISLDYINKGINIIKLEGKSQKITIR